MVGIKTTKKRLKRLIDGFNGIVTLSPLVTFIIFPSLP